MKRCQSKSRGTIIDPRGPPICARLPTAANCVAITVGEHELDVIIETIGDEAIQVFAAKGQAKELGTDEAATDDGDIALFRLMADTLETPKRGQYSCELSLVMGVSR